MPGNPGRLGRRIPELSLPNEAREPFALEGELAGSAAYPCACMNLESGVMTD